MPSDEGVHELLPLYLDDRLEEADVKRFREHLESCGDCRAEKAFLEEVRDQVLRHGSDLFEDHPDPDRLVAHARGALPDAEASAIRHHLDLCITCSAEARWVAGEGVVVAAPLEPQPAGRSGWHGAWVAGLAAALVLAVALPALVIQREEPEFTDSQFVGQRELAGGARVVQIGRGASAWSAHFPLDAETSDFPCTVEVVDRAGRSVERKIVDHPDSLLGGLYLLFRCPRSACPPGSYTLRIESSRGRLLDTIPFDVERAR